MKRVLESILLKLLQGLFPEPMISAAGKKISAFQFGIPGDFTGRKRNFPRQILQLLPGPPAVRRHLIDFGPAYPPGLKYRGKRLFFEKRVDYPLRCGSESLEGSPSPRYSFRRLREENSRGEDHPEPAVYLTSPRTFRNLCTRSAASLIPGSVGRRPRIPRPSLASWNSASGRGLTTAVFTMALTMSSF